MLVYLSMDIVYSKKQTAFHEQSSKKTVSFEEQIISQIKYPRLVLHQMEAIVFIINQIVFAIMCEQKYFMDCKSLYSYVILRPGHISKNNVR